MFVDVKRLNGIVLYININWKLYFFNTVMFKAMKNYNDIRLFFYFKRFVYVCCLGSLVGLVVSSLYKSIKTNFSILSQLSILKQTLFYHNVNKTEKKVWTLLHTLIEYASVTDWGFLRIKNIKRDVKESKEKEVSCHLT